jgi:hypothetical protein
MSLTVVVSERSKTDTMRPDVSSGGRLVCCQTTLINGIPMLGKMSVGLRKIVRTPKIRIRIEITKV